MKYIMVIACALMLAGLTLSACAPSGADSQSPATPSKPYPTKLVMTTTSVGGALQIYGAAVASIIEKNTKVVVAPQPCSGGAELLNLMLRDESQMCTSTANNLLHAYTGIAPFPKSPTIVRGFSGAYESYAHFFVRADSKINSFADLKGKRLMFERPGERNFSDLYPAVLKAYGLQLSDVTILPALTYAEAATALKQNQADCILQYSAVPSPQFLELSRTIPIRYIPIEPAKQPEVIKAAGFLYPGIVKGNIYAGTPNDTPAMVLAAWIGIRADLPEQFAYDAIKAVCTNINDLHAAHNMFKTWIPKDLAANPVIPYAAGVYKYYKEAGLLTPEFEKKQKDMLALENQAK